jgi:two-component system cell cycle response regulator DivK
MELESRMKLSGDASTWKVLIVEDDFDNLNVATQVLSFRGVEVCVAEDGLTGLKALEEFTPTIVLMDISMPQMDGWEMLRHMRDNPRTADLPVIAVTAHAMAGDKERVLAAGFDGYIRKPFDVLTLLDEIKDSLAATEW